MAAMGGKRTLALGGKLDGEAGSDTVGPWAGVERSLKLFNECCNYSHT